MGILGRVDHKVTLRLELFKSIGRRRKASLGICP